MAPQWRQTTYTVFVLYCWCVCVCYQISMSIIRGTCISVIRVWVITYMLLDSCIICVLLDISASLLLHHVHVCVFLLSDICIFGII